MCTSEYYVCCVKCLFKLMLTNVCGMFKLMLMKSYLEGVGVSVMLCGKFRTGYGCVWHEKCLLLIMIAECQMKILLQTWNRGCELNLNVWSDVWCLACSLFRD